MGISDKIEAFILELMKQEQEDWLKIQRNELAQIFGCVPSQINYVISTRFNPERGYMVESKRGGGGCVRIRRIENTPTATDTISESDSRIIIRQLLLKNAITEREALLMQSATSNSALYGVSDKDKTRANILRKMIENTINEEELI